MMKITDNLRGTLELVRIVRELEDTSDTSKTIKNTFINHTQNMKYIMKDSTIKEQPEYDK